MSEAAVSLVEPPGWYGKLPSQGDFVWRRLPAEFIRPWDAWLQRGLAGMRAELGDEAWLARYLVAPIRRFWLAPGLLGACGWIGLLMPSVDRVGRHFPLTIAVPVAMAAPEDEASPATAAVSSLAAALASPQWLATLDQAARRVLDVEFTVEQFESMLAAIAPMQAEAAQDEASMRLARELLVLVDRGIDEGESPVANVWWCEDACEPSQFLTFGALPPPAAFPALLSDPARVADPNPTP